ncbi:MAG: serine--tRNA ligase, partial [Acidobacteria bacterium]|nr:serine--tRNA ligase [Acidobacteriota bacterium]
MLDLAFVRENLELVEQKLRERGQPGKLDRFREVDQQRRRVLTAVESLKSQRNQASEEIGRLKQQGVDVQERIQETKTLSEKIKESDGEVERLDTELREMLVGVPNVPHASVPAGSSPVDNQEVRRWGEPRRFSFSPRPHWELGEALGILDQDRAAKITGARFAVYWDLGAKLERALANFMLD